MLEDHVYNNPRPLRAFERVALQMLQDVQERLVYRTYIYINSDILNNKPAAGDLAYPDKLQMMQVNSQTAIKQLNMSSTFLLGKSWSLLVIITKTTTCCSL